MNLAQKIIASVWLGLSVGIGLYYLSTDQLEGVVGLIMVILMAAVGLAIPTAVLMAIWGSSKE